MLQTANCKIHPKGKFRGLMKGCQTWAAFVKLSSSQDTTLCARRDIFYTLSFSPSQKPFQNEAKEQAQM